MYLASNCIYDQIVLCFAYATAGSYSLIISRRHQWATCSCSLYSVERRVSYPIQAVLEFPMRYNWHFFLGSRFVM